MEAIARKISVKMLMKHRYFLNLLKEKKGIADEHTNRLGYIIIGIVIIGLMLAGAKALFPELIDLVGNKLKELFN